MVRWSDHRTTIMYKLIQSARLYQQVVQQIESSILKGDLKPGAQLPAERDLALQFGVSRTVVREAIKTLSEKGLVEASSGRGTFVRNGTSRAVRESIDLMIRIGHQDGATHLTEIREILEPEIAALAATRIEAQHLSALREAFVVMDNAQEDADSFIEADLDFHLTLAEAAANPLILSLIDSIVGLLREQRMRIFHHRGGPQRGQLHHRRILEAIEQHDAAGAREAMRAHLRQVREDGQDCSAGMVAELTKSTP